MSKNSKRNHADISSDDEESHQLKIVESSEDELPKPKSRKNKVKVQSEDEDFSAPSVIPKSNKKFKIDDTDSYKIVKFPMLVTKILDNGEIEIHLQCPCKVKMVKQSYMYKCKSDKKCGFQVVASAFKTMIEHELFKFNEDGNAKEKYSCLWCTKCNVMTLMIGHNKDWSTYMVPTFKCMQSCCDSHSAQALDFPPMVDSYDFEKIEKMRSLTTKKNGDKSGKKEAKKEDEKKHIPKFDE